MITLRKERHVFYFTKLKKAYLYVYISTLVISETVCVTRTVKASFIVQTVDSPCPLVLMEEVKLTAIVKDIQQDNF